MYGERERERERERELIKKRVRETDTESVRRCIEGREFLQFLPV